jgi:hypothetical protein
MNQQPGEQPSARLFGSYELLGEVARGGMGVVYRARQAGLNRVVALKLIKGGGLAGHDELERFRREAEAIAQLDHPNIVPVYEVGEHEGLPFFSMKLIEAGNLAALLATRPPLRQLVTILAAVARAVHYAHQRGIIHRDLKPGNVLLDAEGQPHVTDFGLARLAGPGRESGEAALTQSGAIVGTPGYMAPEQALGRKGAITTLTDVYSLGAILYECLAGQPPFRAETPVEAVLAVVEKEPEPPSRIVADADRDLEAVCLKCLAKDPQQRYASAQVLAEDLERWLAGEPLSVRPPSTAYLVWLWLRKNVRAALWAALIGALGGGGAALLFLGPRLLVSLAGAANTYDEFPSASRPWLLSLGRAAAPIPFGSLWWRGPVDLVLRVLFCSMGLLATLLLRPRDRWASLAAGLGTGLFAALVAYALVIGPFVTSRRVLRSQEVDLELLAYGCFDPNLKVRLRDDLRGASARYEESRAVMARRYPDLMDRPPNQAAEALARKVRFDLVLDSYQAVWIGLGTALTVCVLPAVLQTVFAGWLLRRYGRVRPTLLLYGELSFFSAWLLVDVVAAIVEPLLGGTVGLTWLGTSTLLGFVAVAAVGAVCRWDWTLRWAIYLTILFALFSMGVTGWHHTYHHLNVVNPGQWVAVSGVLVFGIATGLLLVHHYRRREPAGVGADGRRTGSWGPGGQTQTTRAQAVKGS